MLKNASLLHQEMKPVMTFVLVMETSNGFFSSGCMQLKGKRMMVLIDSSVKIWEPRQTGFSHHLKWRASKALWCIFFFEILQLMPSTTQPSLSKSKFPPTVMSNTLVISFKVFMSWCGFQSQRFGEDSPLVPAQNLSGSKWDWAVYSCFATKDKTKVDYITRGN